MSRMFQYKHTSMRLALVLLCVQASLHLPGFAQEPGTKLWEFSTGGAISSSPAIGSDGTIYIGSNDGFLYALREDGSKKWSFRTGNWGYSSPAIGQDGTVYVGSNDGFFYAV